MLPTVHRMRKPQEFQLTRRTGRKFVYPGVIIHISQGIFDDRPAVVGVTVGKDCGNSVVRHRISRRIRGSIRGLVSGLPQGCGVVIRALPGCTEDFDISAALSESIDKACGVRAQ